MPRIFPGSCLVEISLFDLSTLVKVIEDLTNLGISRVGVALEPGLVHVKVNNQPLAIVVSPLTLILEQCNEGLSSERAIRVAKDAWIEYTLVDLKDLTPVLSSLATCSSVSINFARIVTYGSCPACIPIIVETLSLKHPYRPPVKQVSANSIRETVTNALRKGVVILLACVRDDIVEPLVWLDVKESHPIIYVCCPSEQQMCATVTQSLLDAIVSIAKRSRTIKH